MTCTARLHDGPLVCTRPAGHPGGHLYVASSAPDRHALTEPDGREA
jgi:hypothetical protein